MLKNLITTLMVLCFLPSLIRASDADIDLPQALDMLEASTEGIKSFDVQILLTIRQFIVTEKRNDTEVGKQLAAAAPQRKLLPNEKPQKSEEPYHQVFQKGRGRIDLLETLGGLPTSTMVYDKEIQKRYYPKASSAIIDQRSSLALAGGKDYRESYRSLISGVPLVACLRERKKVLLTQPTADTPFVVIEAAPDPGADVTFDKWGFRVSIDPGRGFLPVLTEIFEEVNGQRLPRIRREITMWKNQGGGLQVPVQTTMRGFITRHEKPELIGALSIEQVMQVDQAHSTWNAEIPDNVFEIALPAGTRVTDAVHQVSYVTGKADLGKNLEDLAANGREIVPIYMGRPEPSKQSYLGMFIAGAVVVATISAFVIVVFRIRRNRLGRRGQVSS
jgi:hypothetical protein